MYNTAVIVLQRKSVHQRQNAYNIQQKRESTLLTCHLAAVDFTGDQDGKYTNWLREESPGACVGPRCVALTAHASESARQSAGDNFRWLDGACGLSLDGYVCQYHFKGMCPPLEPEAGSETPRYTTPFRLTSTLLTHIPFGTVVVAPCPAAADAAGYERTALCVERDDGSVGWSAALPPCSSDMVPQDQEDREDREDQDWCAGDHGCEQHCQLTESDYSCFCSVGYTLDEDGYGCNPDDRGEARTDAPTDDYAGAETPAPPAVDRACVEAGCQYNCVETARGVRCTCPPGYRVDRDGRGCADVDECRQRPCLQECVNTPGTFHCDCYPGYQPDDEGECVDVDECLDEGSCQGDCQNTEGSFSCLCQPGYERGGEGECVDIDECERESPCRQLCVNGEGRFTCDCKSGYNLHADGVTCEPSPEDEEYSTLTPDPVDVAQGSDHAPYTPPGVDANANPDRELPWFTAFTPDPNFENDPDFDSDWLTEAPGETTADLAPPPGSDARPNQQDGHSPRQRHDTAPPPTARDGRLDDVKTGAGVGDAGDQPDGRGEAEVPNVSGSQAGTGAKAGGRDEVHAGEDTGEAGKQKHDKSWLLVALLVPLCVFLVVMLALGIVYCTSCAVDKNHRFSDCYRWVLPATPPVVTSNGKPQA